MRSNIHATMAHGKSSRHTATHHHTNIIIKNTRHMLHETPPQRDERFMRQAIAEAIQAAQEGEIPIGAVITHNDTIIARAHNLTERLRDVTAHAEMQAITSAATHLGGKYLTDCTLYVTVEPCPMCAGALGWSQIPRIVYGTPDPRRGYTTLLTPGAGTPLHPRTSVTTGILAEECRNILQNFFSARR